MLRCHVHLNGQVSRQGLPNEWKLETLREGVMVWERENSEEQCHKP